MGGDHLQGLNLGLQLRLRWLLLRVPLLLLLLLLLLRGSVLVLQDLRPGRWGSLGGRPSPSSFQSSRRPEFLLLGFRPREMLRIEQGAPDPRAVLIDSDRHEESTVGVPA